MSGISPYLHSPFRTPFGDALAQLGNCQHYWRCRELELNVLDCTDVYGHKGLTKQCKEELADYYECLFGDKSLARVAAMRKERMRQYMAGERSKKNLYLETPKLDSYYKTYTKNID
ncbi:NADH dehydrogenase [ubiquinone] iron-sulfur protein 5 [Parasteatoda tepidariorum]|uniref:NADH dehydrogenase [ubiquinone] iron-sulfur protein 5 n=1 Tax=Parasteatoda tepidariorum TaxID=114398 RepID=UPI00077FCCB9|nr:NADH dehydrogenase [ubiquinone] iron-sulfur protein 5 [Parasteatoda tepidariorum]XP_015915496.1 NADH dehydrogenase [ubiquinone] iron-sulfur protein 5 [Parasteatoda tepidariorum]